MIKLYKQQVINLHKQIIESTGGSLGVRDLELLDSSLNNPFQSFNNVELYPSILHKAALLAFGLY